MPCGVFVVRLHSAGSHILLISVLNQTTQPFDTALKYFKFGVAQLRTGSRVESAVPSRATRTLPRPAAVSPRRAVYRRATRGEKARVSARGAPRRRANL